jgi:hypothetical protein
MSPNERQPPKRNIDERLDALTTGMELQAGMLRDLDINIEKLGTKIDALTVNVDKLTINMNRLTSIVETLAGFVQSHERRITSLEGGHPA